MKTQPAFTSPRTFGQPGPRSGVALISVLAVILLLTILVVTFLIRAEMARSSSASYRATTDTRLLSDTVVNLVQAEINDATTYGSTGTTGQTTGTGPYTWASQPGAIRTYDSTGTLQKIYRLYSAPSLAASAGSELANDLPPTTWSSSPAVWVDLNAPVSVTGMTDATGASVASYKIYPILDNRDPITPTKAVQIPGFFVNTVNGGSTLPTTTAALTTLNQPVMPVRWLYVTRNGRILSPDQPATGNSVTFNNVTPVADKPSKDNPIVGRVAFWTDDESGKVNINTAAGSVSTRADTNGTASVLPAAWDIPRFGGSWEDLKLFADNQPVQGEYQRYPGHPATTGLYKIFNGLGVPMPEISNALTANAYRSGYTAGVTTQLGGSIPTGITSTLFSFLPRYNDNFGSQAGIANTTISNSPTLPTAKRDRLYTSLGELLYTSARTQNGTLTRQQIETGKFFLTPHSRAPEVTLFGTPRVTMWPVPDTTKTAVNAPTTQTRTAYDQLLAFCSTTNTGKGNAGNAYYFQRYDRASTTNDWDQELRNQSLYSYLQDLTSANIPGFGGNFGAKYGSSKVSTIATERDQILTEMVDYIRCTNLYDHSWSTTTTPNRYTPQNKAEVVPLQVTTTRGGITSVTHGLGRIETLSEIAVAFICTADGSGAAYVEAANPGGWLAPVSPLSSTANDVRYVSNLPERQFLRNTSGNPVAIDGSTATSTTPAALAFPCNETLSTSGDYVGPNAPRSSYTVLTNGQKKFQAILLFEMACPMQGFDLMTSQDVRIKVSNIEGITASGTAIFPNRTTTANTGSNLNGNGYYDGSPGLDWVRYLGYNDFGGIQGFLYPLLSYGKVVVGLPPVTYNYNNRFNGWSGVGGKYVLPPGTADPNDTQKVVLGSIPYAPITGTVPYRYISNPFTQSTSTLTLAGGCTAELQMPTGSPLGTTNTTYQTFALNFPSQVIPAPSLPVNGLDYTIVNSTTIRVTHANDWWGFDNRIGWAGLYSANGAKNGSATFAFPNLSMSSLLRTDTPNSSYTAPATWTLAGSHGSMTTKLTNPTDSLRSIVAKDADYRLVAAKSSVAADPSASVPDFSLPPSYATAATTMTHLLMDASTTYGGATFPGGDQSGKLVSGANYANQISPKVPSTFSAGTPNPQLSWDWDNGLYNTQDGAYANKPDEGNSYSSANTIPYMNLGNPGTITSYFTPNRMIASPVAFGSLPTGVAEGIPWRTLLFRPQANRGTITSPLAATPKDYLWLDLFNMPVVQPYAISEPFSTAGKVNMNYQIQPFTYITRSTAVQAVLGSELIARVPKVDASVPTSVNNPQAIYQGAGSAPTQNSSQSGLYNAVNASKGIVPARLPLNLSDVNGSLRQFKERFAGGDIFRSAAEICDIYLVPTDSLAPTSYTGWMSDALADAGWYGDDFALVGDNVRERPYGNLYARLTTKSNTFTVYYKVQVLKNPTTVDQTQWNESTGVVNGEYRASTTLERYLDPNNNAIPDYTDSTKNPAVTSTAPGLDTFYQWRVVANTAFAP